MKPNYLANAVDVFATLITSKGGLSAGWYPSFFDTAHLLKGLRSFDLAMARYIRCPGVSCQPAIPSLICQTATMPPQTFIWRKKRNPLTFILHTFQSILEKGKSLEIGVCDWEPFWLMGRLLTLMVLSNLKMMMK